MRTAGIISRPLFLALTLMGIGALRTHAEPAPARSGNAVSVSARLAIIAEQPSAPTAADLLTAELSAKQGVQLLERNEINKVYQEQGLSAGNKDYLKLGQVLGADGLLLLSSLAEGTNQFLQTRLVAVGPGVVIASVRCPWPIADTVGWANWTARHFEPFMPKLSVLVKDAIPISVVNVRSAVRSAEEEETERQLTLLAVERLSHEREFFVLERQRMELLGAEKELRGGGEAAFWNGSHLLDGVVDRDGYSKDVLTLNARLLPSKGGIPVLIEVSGSRTNLAEVVNRLAAKVRDALRLRARSTPWDPAEEAARYLQEAKWAFRWGMLSEAQAACESSWALGNTSREVAELRIRIYGQRSARPQNDWLWMHPTSPDYAPDTAKLEPAIHALELYQQGFHIFVANEPKPDTNWYRLGQQLLGSDLLRQFNYFPDAGRGREDRLAALRLLSRATVEMVGKHPLYTNLSLSVPGAYWYETPEEAFQVYRQLVEAGRLHADRMTFVHHNLVGWNAADKERSPVLWRGFIAELCASTNPLTRVEGCFLNFADAKPPQQLERVRTLFKVALEAEEPLVAAGLVERLMEDFKDLHADMPRGFDYYIGMATDNAYIAFQKDFNAARVARERVARLEAMRDYLTGLLSGKKPLVGRQFFDLFREDLSDGTPFYREPEAKEMIPPLQELKRRLEQGPLAKQPSTGEVLSYVNTLLPRLEAILAPPQGPLPATKAVAQAQPLPRSPRQPGPWLGPGFPTTRQITNQIPRLPTVLTNVLTVKHVWPWPTDLVPGYIQEFTAGAACFRNGRVWVEVTYKDERYQLSKALVFALDPGTFAYEVVELPLSVEKITYSSTESKDIVGAGKSFEVMADYLFYSLSDKLKRYSLNDRTWQDLPVPGAGRLTLLDGRLFSTTDDAIVEVSASGDSQTILASARRRPPVTVLDSLENYQSPPLFHGPNGSIATRVQGKLYALEEKTHTWSEITRLPERPSAVPLAGSRQRVFLYRVAARETNQVLLPDDQFSIAMTAPPPAHSARRQYPSLQPIIEGPDLSCSRVYLEGTNAWVYFGYGVGSSNPAGPTIVMGSSRAEFVKGQRVTLPGPDLPSLYVVWMDWGEPLNLALELDFKSAGLTRDRLYGSSGQRGLFGQAIPTPAGIALVNARLGLWLIPWDDLGAALKAAREERIAQQKAQMSAINALWANLFQKYHFTQKDNYTPEQKEAMIDDPLFVELNLDKIDANRNGRLDAAELIFFDANQNGKLEPQELAGIEATQSLLARRLLDDFGLKPDAPINSMQLQWLRRSLTDGSPNSRGSGNLGQFGWNGGGAGSGLTDVQRFLMQETLSSLGAVPGFRGRGSEAYAKYAIESYWAKSGGTAAGDPTAEPRTIREARDRKSPVHSPMVQPSR